MLYYILPLKKSKFILIINTQGVTLKLVRDIDIRKPSVCIVPPAVISSNDVDNNITNDSDESAGSSRLRTLKAMRAALAGFPILTPVWVDSCLEEGRIVTPTNTPSFLNGSSNNNVTSKILIRTLPTKVGFTKGSITEGKECHCPGDGTSPRNGVIALAAKWQKGGPRLLDGVSVCLCGKWVGLMGVPPKRDVGLLLREAGAMVLGSTVKAIRAIPADSVSATSVVLLLDDDGNDKGKNPGDNGDVTEAQERATREVIGRKRNVLVVNASWLFDCISYAVVLNGRDYPPSSPRAKSLWKITNSVSS